MSKIKLRVTRPLCMHGQHQEAGVILSLEPAAAADALESGRVELLDKSDAPTVLAGRRREVMELMGRQRLMASPGSPWFPIQ